MEKTLLKTRLLVWIFLVVPLWAAAQELHLHRYTNKDGLADDYTECLYQDTRGYLWLGTDNGLSRFDGHTFTNFYKSSGLPGKRITAVVEDVHGNTWAATNSGICCFTRDGLKSYTARDGLPNNSIQSIGRDGEGRLWIATENGLSRFDGRGFKTFTTADGLPSNMVFCLLTDNDGKIWVGTKKGLTFFVGGVFKQMAWARSLEKTSITWLCRDSQGRTWIGTSNGLKCYKQGSITSYNEEDGLRHRNITSIVEDAQGRIWVGTWNGLALFTGTGFINFTNQNGLPDNVVCCLLRDREGNLWIGTVGGVCRLNTTNIISFSTNSCLPNNMVLDIIEDHEGRYWVGTPEGLACWTGNRFKVFTTRDGLVNNYIQNLAEDRGGDLWVATLGGLSKYAGGVFTNYTPGHSVAGNNIFEITEDRQGTLWLGLRGQVKRFVKGTFLPPPFTAPPFTALKILEDSRGNLWFGTLEGLYRYNEKALTRYTTGDGLPDDWINSLWEDSKGRLWIATTAGLSCFHRGAFRSFTTKDGLPDNNCRFVVGDDFDRPWIGTANGVACFDGRNFKSYKMETHDLVSRAWNTGFKDRKGHIWLGSNDGITRFTMPPFPVNSYPPPVYITAVKVLEEDIPLDFEKEQQFDHRRNYFRFHFTGISYMAPKSVLYKYRLSNLDREWKTTTDRSIFYPYLPPGAYRFEVKAINNDGYESTAPASFRFHIRPPFWRTWWFQGLLLLAVLGLAAVFFHLRLRRVREKQVIKTQQLELRAKNQQLVMSQRMELLGTLAAGAVHDLKNLLAIIIGYSRLAAKEPGLNDSRPTSIEHIKNTAHSAVNVVGQILAFTRQPHYDVVEANLPDLLEETLDILKVTRPENIEILWQPPTETILMKINPTRFQQVVMNICLNAFQAMTDGGRLVITMAKLPDQAISISFIDTGSGIPESLRQKIFDPMFTTKEQGKGTGLGLFVVKQIVAEYNGTIDVHSTPGKGTTFIVTLKTRA